MQYLEKQKSGIYRYRRDVPEDIQDCVGLKRYKKSLHTGDKDTAIEKWKLIDTEINVLFQRCRLRKRVSLPDKTLLNLTLCMPEYIASDGAAQH